MKEDKDWFNMLAEAIEENVKTSDYLPGKWFVFANLKGIFIKRIAKVWGHECTEYVLEFEDGSRDYVDVDDMRRLIDDGSFEGRMWLFENHDDIHIDENVREKYIREIHNLEIAKNRVKDIEDRIEELRAVLISGREPTAEVK